MPTTRLTVLPSGRESPEAPIAGSGAVRDSGDMLAAIPGETLCGDTPGVISAVVLPFRRGGTLACDVTGAVAALGTPGVPGTAVPMPGAALRDHVSVPGAAPC